MDKKIAGLIGAVTALASFDVAHAATVTQYKDAMTVNSYDDLLKPIPNATALLKTSDAVLADEAAAEQPKVELAQFYHHHHHHHRWWRRWYHHHHHHHHHHHWWRHHHYY